MVINVSTLVMLNRDDPDFVKPITKALWLSARPF